MTFLEAVPFIFNQLFVNLPAVIALIYCLSTRACGLKYWLCLGLVMRLAGVVNNTAWIICDDSHGRIDVTDPYARIIHTSPSINSVLFAASLTFVCLAMFELWCSTRFRSSAWKQAFSWKGRASRAQWWGITMFFQGLELTAMSSLTEAINGTSDTYVRGTLWSLHLERGGWVRTLYSILMLVVVGLLLWVTLAAYIKRWHDRGKSGWMSLIVLIPIAGQIWTLVELGFLPGSSAPNRWGESEILEPSSRDASAPP